MRSSAPSVKYVFRLCCLNVSILRHHIIRAAQPRAPNEAQKHIAQHFSENYAASSWMKKTQKWSHMASFELKHQINDSSREPRLGDTY
ncbi:MAG: hypothetical protein CL912_23520 [Deltaproteobacteria bacterium]|nr:hypothetical protein [Deltaproteobacteria bacterium]